MSSTAASSIQQHRSSAMATSSSNATSEYIFVDPRSIERHMRKEARKLFVLERADVLMQLPVQYKRSFNRVMFWMKQYPMPVLLVSCYDVPPGPLRSQWMSRFLQEREKNNGMVDMPLLVYQYGVLSGPTGSAADRPIEEAYAFLDPSQNELYSFEEGVQLGYDQIPRALQKKILLQLALKDFEKQALDARKELQEDSSYANGEPRGGFPKFDEGYNMIYCKENNDNQPPCPDAAISCSSPPRTSLSATAAASSDTMASPVVKNMAKLKVGSRIEVYWPDDAEYYPAIVTQVRGSFYFIHYDDGEEEWLPLAEHEFLIHGDGPESSIKPAAKPTQKWTLREDDDDELMDDDEDDDDLLDDEDDDSDRAPKKRAKQRLFKIPKKAKSLSMDGADDEPSQYVKTSVNRFTDDGCIIPKQTLRKLSDGTFAAPVGRHPQGTYFDNCRGVFVYKMVKTEPMNADHPGQECTRQGEGQQPFKKRKVVE